MVQPGHTSPDMIKHYATRMASKQAMQRSVPFARGGLTFNRYVYNSFLPSHSPGSVPRAQLDLTDGYASPQRLQSSATGGSLWKVF